MTTHLRTIDIKSGVWTDYDLPWYRNQQFLVHEETAQMITNAIAIVTTLVLPRSLILIQLCLPSILRLVRRVTRFKRGRLEREPGRFTSHMLETFQEADSIGAAATGLTYEHLGMQHIEIVANKSCIRIRCREIYSNFQEDRWGFGIICLAIVVLGAFYIGIQIIAILTAGIISGSFGISNSAACGWWLPVSPVTNGRPPGPAIIVTEDDYEAMSYVESHYGGETVVRRGFEDIRQKIEYKKYHDMPCPFTYDHCIGNDSALILDTGVQSSRVLGINTAEQLFFRKQTICAPLISHSSRSSPFSDMEPGDGIEQRYGARHGDSYTSMQVMRRKKCNEYRYLFSDFRLVVNTTEGIPRVPWTVDGTQQEFKSWNNRAVLFFVKSCGILYIGPSSDPIFPADLEDASGLWTDSSEHPHILGCQESREICGPTGVCSDLEQLRSGKKDSWDYLGASSNGSVSEMETFDLLYLLLSFSHIELGASKNSRLLAERLHDNSLSLALDDKHWQLEIHRLFEISLAHLQITAVNIARGKNSNRANYRLVDLPGWNPGIWRRACSSIKIQTIGWKNINLIEFVCFSAALSFLWISTIKYRERVLLLWIYILLMGPLTRLYEVIKRNADNLVSAMSRVLRAMRWQKAFHQQTAKATA